MRADSYDFADDGLGRRKAARPGLAAELQT